MHIIGSSWELALFCVVAPNLVSVVRPVALGHLLPRQSSSDTQEWDMEMHINKTTRNLGTRAPWSWCCETVRSSAPQENRCWASHVCCFFHWGRRFERQPYILFRYGCCFISVFAPELASWKQKKHISKGLRRVCSVFFCGLCDRQEGLWGQDSRIYSL